VFTILSAVAENERDRDRDAKRHRAEQRLYNESGYFPPPCCRRAGLQYAFRHEESGSQHDFRCC